MACKQGHVRRYLQNSLLRSRTLILLITLSALFLVFAFPRPSLSIYGNQNSRNGHLNYVVEQWGMARHNRALQFMQGHATGSSSKMDSGRNPAHPMTNNLSPSGLQSQFKVASFASNELAHEAMSREDQVSSHKSKTTEKYRIETMLDQVPKVVPEGIPNTNKPVKLINQASPVHQGEKMSNTSNHNNNLTTTQIQGKSGHSITRAISTQTVISDISFKALRTVLRTTDRKRLKAWRQELLDSNLTPKSKSKDLNATSAQRLDNDPLRPLKLDQVITGSNHSEKPTKQFPKAIIIGAKKAGTRALLDFLRIHPNIDGPGPEPHFFDRNYDKGLDWYRELMPPTYSHQITIEKTPAYLVSPQVPRRVHDLDPNMKVLLVVRDPISRAVSDYCQAATKHQVRPFEEMAMLNESTGQVKVGWSAISIGLYARHLTPWLEVFPKHQIHIVDGARLVSSPAEELALVEEFLGLPKFIKSTHFKLRGFKNTFPCLTTAKGQTYCLSEISKGRQHPVVRANVIKILQDFYRSYNNEFFGLVGRKFDWDT